MTILVILIITFGVWQLKRDISGDAQGHFLFYIYKIFVEVVSGCCAHKWLKNVKFFSSIFFHLNNKSNLNIM